MKPREQRRAELDQKTHAELVNEVLALQDSLGWINTSLAQHAEQMNAQTKQMAARVEALKAEENR